METDIISSINALPQNVISDLERSIINELDKSGIFYRVFSRKKDASSVAGKIKRKNYSQDSKKLQDLYGIRIALYFKDDIEICTKIIETKFKVVDTTIDAEEDTEFKPVRLNIVCLLPEDIKEYILPSFWDDFPIDCTFEIQIRTVFSEGWHEIEHDFRYKHKDEWETSKNSNRILNGIFATLETCDWSIITLLDQIAYDKYLQKEWDAMLRNTYRIRVKSEPLNKKIIDIFNGDSEIAKKFLKIDRKVLIANLTLNKQKKFPLTLSNIVFFANKVLINDSNINSIMPQYFIDLNI